MELGAGSDPIAPRPVVTSQALGLLPESAAWSSHGQPFPYLALIIWVMLSFIIGHFVIRWRRRRSERSEAEQDMRAGQTAQASRSSPGGAAVSRYNDRQPEDLAPTPSGVPIPELLAATAMTAAAATIRRIVPAASGFVLFQHGTFVMIDGNASQPAAEAIAIIRQDGPVVPGGFLGDFSTLTLKDGMGHLVSSHNDRLFTYIAPEQLAGTPRHDLEIGLFGRSMRALDAEEREIIHIGRPVNVG